MSQPSNLACLQMGERLSCAIDIYIKSRIVAFGSNNKADAVYLATCAAQTALKIVAQLTAPEQSQADSVAHQQSAPVSQSLN